MTKTLMTVSLIYEPPQILLGMKKRGFGQGRWNGFGGKVKQGESIEESAIREIKEETGIFVEEIERRGIIDFEFQEKPGEILEVHFFKIKKYSGVPSESEEMFPKWFHIDEIPYKEMWPDDKYWMPLFLENKKFRGKIYFKDQNTILNQKIEIIS